MRRLALRSVAATVGGLPVPAFANPESSVTPLTEVVLRAGLSLAAVLAVIGALAFLLRRLRAHPSLHRSQGRLASLAKLDLGARREIRLLEADGRLLVVGVTPERVELLTTLTEDGAESREAPPELRVLQELTTSS